MFPSPFSEDMEKKDIQFSIMSKEFFKFALGTKSTKNSTKMPGGFSCFPLP